jgi:CubicO group peptidase (beta-lactamase class C family)/uncharacterized protein (DUF302 family)
MSSITSTYSFAKEGDQIPMKHYNVNRGNPHLKAQGKYIDKMIADFVEKYKLPGIAMAIVQAPYIPRSAGYGLSSLTNDELASTKTMWNIGQITQGFTATSILQLFEENKLNIYDPISKYISNLPSAWKKVTILQLLQHASGIPDFRDANYNENKSYKPEELIKLVSNKSLLFSSGTKVSMSATNFILLGLIIEKSSGMSYYQYVKQYQIIPLGLKSTMFTDDLDSQSFIDRPEPETGKNQHQQFKSKIPFVDPVEPATGYKENNGNLKPVTFQATNNLFSFGGLWSSAEDISKWDIAIAANILVKKSENRDLIYKPTKLSNGTVVPAMAGWEFYKHPGFMDIKGSTPGFSSYLSRFTAPNDLVCVTLLTNKQGIDLSGLARDIAEAYKAGLGSGVDSDNIITKESLYSVDETIGRLESELKKRNVKVFSIIDHTKGAKENDLELRPTKVIIFGDPKVGTKLMIDNQTSSLDLPLRISVSQDQLNRVWVSYHNMDKFAEKYNIRDIETVIKIQNFLQNLVNKVSNVYIDEF